MAIVDAPPAVRPGLAGLLALADALDEPLEPFQRRIARAHFGPEREVVAVLPRGNKKTTTAALIALHHLLTVPAAAVTLGAASRDQARIAYERIKGFALHPALADSLVIRHLELRHEDDDGQLRLLRAIPSDGPRAHGLSSSLYLGDEVWAWKGEDLLEAMLTGLVKRPDARFLGISTAAARLASPLGRYRARALAGRVTRSGALIDARSPGLRWLEWSVGEDVDLGDYRAVKRANPAGYITPAGLHEQAERVAPISFAQFHACRWGSGEGSWLPPGAWSACAGSLAPEDAPVVVGVDIGGSRAASGVVAITRDLQVAEVHVFQGDEAVLEVVACIENMATRRPILEVAHDPWRFRSEALRLERELRLLTVEVPMSSSRMVAASGRLHSVIIEKRLTHPDHPALNAHVANAVAKTSGGGWRLDKAGDGLQIDALIALMLAVERASIPAAEPARILGWL